MGACLDRNGLRPARYWRTKDDLIYVASEVRIVVTGEFHGYLRCFTNHSTDAQV